MSDKDNLSDPVHPPKEKPKKPDKKGEKAPPVEKVTVKELLEQCQQSAVILGQTIEVEEGEGTAAVHVLEEYCEQVYQIYVTADMVRTRGNIKHIYKVLDGFLVD